MFYPDEAVRLRRNLPELGLFEGNEGTTIRTLRDQQGEVQSVEARFYVSGRPVTVSTPEDALELVIATSSLEQTAVFWGLSERPEKILENAVHTVLDCGILMREGLNAVRLHYDRNERWWKWGEKFRDPTGALAVSAGSGWDGCIVAFSGRQRFHLEFRLPGRGGPTLLLHESHRAYVEQASSTPPAMSLARVLLDLYEAVRAESCAFPVAGAWLADEEWRSLIREPYYPDFFLLPEQSLPPKIAAPYRAVKLTDDRVMMTSLPVKFAPSDPGAQRTERDLKLDRLRKCKSLGEKYYDQMYETSYGVNGLYSSAKDSFTDAIIAANELGLKEEAAALAQRLDHIKSVFRSQFS